MTKSASVHAQTIDTLKRINKCGERGRLTDVTERPSLGGYRIYNHMDIICAFKCAPARLSRPLSKGEEEMDFYPREQYITDN